MKKLLPTILFIPLLCVLGSFTWGFYAHQKINRLAVFTLPPEMMGFYKHHIAYITEAAVHADRRRYAVVEEGARHYLDLDHYGDSALHKMPRYWEDAVKLYTEDTLKAYGILPWHINRVYFQLKESFLMNDPDRILKLSADLGHYLADAHVPLHTTENYNGQRTGQEGIHAFWESRLPELFAEKYTFFVGKATYINNPQIRAWKAIESAHRAVDSVLRMEKQLSEQVGEKKFTFETKGKQTQRVYTQEYASAYHRMMAGMVERQMRMAVKTIGDYWYSAWVDAGQPDLKKLINYKPSEEELKKRKREIEQWRKSSILSRQHENSE